MGKLSDPRASRRKNRAVRSLGVSHISQAFDASGRFLPHGVVKPAVVVTLTRQQKRYQARMAAKGGAK